MYINPILAALRHHLLSATLIILQIALACAVLCNAYALIVGRLQLIQLHSGVDENSLALVSLTGYDKSEAADMNAKVLGGLRAIPGVQSLNVINTVPFGPRVAPVGITLDADGKHFGGVIDFYLGDPGSIQALGVKLVEGRWPQAEDYVPVQNFVPANGSALITRTLAQHLWPDKDPLGRELWADKFHFRVIGVLAHLAIPAPGGGEEKNPDWSVFVPAQPGPFFSGSYLLRADPRDLPRVLRDARAAVAKLVPNVVLDRENSQTVHNLRHRYFERDRSMAGMLVGTITALLLVTALGIVGLVSFWVGQRRRQIGIRRALGATRRDILRYFQTENFLIVTFGVLLGILLTIVMNLILIKFYAVSRLPYFYLLLSAVTLWLLGQLAVLAPALHASTIPPAVATRSV